MAWKQSILFYLFLLTFKKSIDMIVYALIGGR